MNEMKCNTMKIR
jgi:hypothetical protein